MSLIDLPKDKTSTKAYQKRFKEVVENKYKGWNHMYTDGSECEIGVGVAASTGNCTQSASLSKFSSIFTAETYAIQLALNTIFTEKRKNFSIFTDSRSCLQAHQLKHTKASLQQLGKTVEVCWIPGHADIPGNEIADKKKQRSIKTARRIDTIPL